VSLTADFILRYSFGRGQKRFTRVVAWASMLGMVLGVASLIVVLSIMNGFSAELHQRILSVVPHVEISRTDASREETLALVPNLTTVDGVRGAAPFQRETVLLQSHGRRRGAQINALPLDGLADVSGVVAATTRGDFQAMARSPFTVALGSTLARLLGVTVGDDVEVLLPRVSVTPLRIYPRTRRLRVVAEFEVGADPDAREAFVSIETAHRLTGHAGYDGIQVQLDDLWAVDTVGSALGARLDSAWILRDWRQTQGALFEAVRMEKLTVGLLLFSVVAVAAFNIVSTLTMSVTEKRSDIAVLRVMGLPRSRVLVLFMGHGLVLGLIGIAIGAVTGVAVATHVTELALLLERWLGVRLFDPAVYYIGVLPSELQWSDVLLTVVISLVLSGLAALYPAWRATRIDPAEVLNHV